MKQRSQKKNSSLNSPAASSSVSSSTIDSAQPSTRREGLIAARAYEIWQNAGCPEGQDREHWMQAERDVESAYENQGAHPDVPSTVDLATDGASAISEPRT